jgi:hypothetical protein
MCSPVQSTDTDRVQHMSGDDLHALPRTPQTDPPRDSAPAVTTALSERGDRAGADTAPAEVLSAVADEVRGGDGRSLPSGLVTQHLDEILVALIALRTEETHGTGLMEELAACFDVQPSPGTVYPRLHDLDADGTLSRHDLVQTKQYSIANHERAETLLDRAMQQHFTLGLFLRAARDAV